MVAVLQIYERQVVGKVALDETASVTEGVEEGLAGMGVGCVTAAE